jgi:hypothetical protein
VRRSFSVLALVPTLAVATAASAVLIDTADGGGNSGVAFRHEPLVNVGTRGSTTAVYLGSGAVITANHVGAGRVVFHGASYQPVPGSAVRLRNPDASRTDLLLFAIHPQPDLPPLEIASTPPPLESQILIAGNGLDRGSPTWFDPNGADPPGPVVGYRWGSTRRLRYGINRVEAAPPGGSTFDTRAFSTSFDGDAPGPEGQAVPGDSGGAAFWRDPSGEWQLAGVILAIEELPGQPANASFFGQKTYYADLSYYRARIEELVALPEPSGALAPGIALAAALAARRRRQPSRMRLTASRSVDSLPIG